eukprot:CAMPEP_0172434356 /NCGR_PEP_ID=MMETSP1064-20121228/70589_1 /TAXON_ID=202472 /ORGANISM="Aulacoseira subarctica , Strain CCAP 1002/5" /LENGTH=264 /DNA_ID=CAMNT_0013182569 /DNA_START=545 /DNA_END=1336 /DNA_ORIENTATION=-
MVKQKLIRRKKLRAFVQSSFVSDNAYDEHQKGLGDIFQRLIRFVCEPFFQINNLSEEDRLRIQQSAWHTAVDPDSKRTYYYNLETYETQWEKPMDLASGMEYLQMIEHEQKKREFFAAMELNIRTSLSLGHVPGTCSIPTTEGACAEDSAANEYPNEERTNYCHSSPNSNSREGRVIRRLAKDASIDPISSETTASSTLLNIIHKMSFIKDESMEKNTQTSVSDTRDPAESKEYPEKVLRNLLHKISSMDDKLLRDRENGNCQW